MPNPIARQTENRCQQCAARSVWYEVCCLYELHFNVIYLAIQPEKRRRRCRCRSHRVSLCFFVQAAPTETRRTPADSPTRTDSRAEFCVRMVWIAVCNVWNIVEHAFCVNVCIYSSKQEL